MLSQGDSALEFYSLQSHKLSQKDIQKLIQEYLIHHCYQQTANEFGKDCKLIDEMDIDNNLDLDERRVVCELVKNGEIQEALEYLDLHFPELFKGDDQQATMVMFELKCQQFIENVCVDATEALEFAQKELGSFSAIPTATSTLQDIISLIAYPTPQSSPLSHYLSQERRNLVSYTLNNFIISKSGGNSWSGLERLVQQATAVRERLNAERDMKNKVIFGWLMNRLFTPSGPFQDFYFRMF